MRNLSIYNIKPLNEKYECFMLEIIRYKNCGRSFFKRTLILLVVTLKMAKMATKFKKLFIGNH